MRHLKYFSLFESRLHNLDLPKSKSDLDRFKSISGFKNIQSLRTRRPWDLIRMRNGGLEIIGGPYSFKVSPTGKFFYGSYEVGPKYDTTIIDSWDKLFDYAYIYLLSKTESIIDSGTLENFVFNATINSSAYNTLKDSNYYNTIFNLSKKYNGQKTLDSVKNAISKSDSYINDANLILDTRFYKYFSPILGFSSNISDDKSSISINLESPNPMGVFSSFSSLIYYRDIVIHLEKSKTLQSNKTLVKTIKGLENTLLNRLSDLKDSICMNKLYRTPIRSAIMAEICKIYHQILNDYIKGGESYNFDIKSYYEPIIKIIIDQEIQPDRQGLAEPIMSYLTDIDLLMKDPIFNEEFKKIGDLKNIIFKKMDLAMDKLRSENPIKYSKLINDLDEYDDPEIKELIKQREEKDSDIIKAGNLLRKMGLGD